MDSTQENPFFEYNIKLTIVEYPHKVLIKPSPQKVTMNPYISALALMLVAVVITVAILLLAELIGPKIKFRDKQAPFECGEDQIVSPKLRFSVKFYIVALVFVLFDIEAVFLYPWAVLYRQLGLFGLIEMLIFIAVLGVGLVYVWKKGALEWE